MLITSKLSKPLYTHTAYLVRRKRCNTTELVEKGCITSPAVPFLQTRSTLSSTSYMIYNAFTKAEEVSQASQFEDQEATVVVRKTVDRCDGVAFPTTFVVSTRLVTMLCDAETVDVLVLATEVVFEAEILLLMVDVSIAVSAPGARSPGNCFCAGVIVA